MIDKTNFDDPKESLEAGSSDEADLLQEWSSWDLVEKIQELDQQLYNSEQNPGELAPPAPYSQTMTGYGLTLTGYPLRR